MKTLIFSFLLAGLLIIQACTSTSTSTFSGITPEFESCWTTVGSAGVVDDGPDGVVNLGRTALPAFVPPNQPFTGPAINQLQPFDGVVSIKSNAETAFNTIRYNIGQFIERKGGGTNLNMYIRYLVKDTSLHRVIVMLKRYSIGSPLNNEPGLVISTFDSFNHPPSNDYQTQSVSVNLSNDPFSGRFNHRQFAYYVDVLLIKYKAPDGSGPILVEPVSLAPAAPAVAVVQVCEEVIIDDN